MLRFFDPTAPLEVRRGRLPHWRQDEALYFCTFRLYDSLPARVLRWWSLQLQGDDEDARKDERLRRYHDYLDRGYGSCVLGIPEVRKIVLETIAHFDGTRYRLDECAVASNHVHTLVQPMPGWDLSNIVGTWKSYSAKRILEIDVARERLEAGGRVRRVWQKEGFDHLVRSAEHLEQYRTYIRKHG